MDTPVSEWGSGQPDPMVGNAAHGEQVGADDL